MPELQPLDADHASAVLAFERANRAYFAASISDRGDAYFEQFTDHFAETLADGTGAFYLYVADDGSILGRFNLYRIDGRSAEVGYRMAENAVGRGLATAAVVELCRRARTRHGLSTLRAVASDGNVASQRVLCKAGFTPIGRADPTDLGGKPGTWYQRDLVHPGG